MNGTKTIALGDLKKPDVRQVWRHEAADFTPWLTSEDNIVRLGNALGIELEVENCEVAVGPYSADILAKDTGTGKYVVIENQLGRTDHDHLGKAITYGSVLAASAVVWIATEFTEEHQKALEWLNDNTGEDIAFYGVQVELWQIDGSRPAVRFNVVSKPAEIVRQAAAVKAAENMTDAKRLQLQFWTRVRERLLAEKVVPSKQTPRPQYWFDVSLGRSGIVLSNTANTFDGKVGVRVYLYNNIADKAMPQLEARREQIEREIGEKLIWNPTPEKRDKIIGLYYDADISDEQQAATAGRQWARGPGSGSAG